MSKCELKSWFLNEFGNKVNRSQRKVENKHPDKLKLLKDYTSYLPEESRYIERLYHLLHDRESVVTCYEKDCTNRVKFIDYKNGYYKFCSTRCSTNNEEVSNKRKNTCHEKYGVKNPSQSEVIKEKHTKTLMEKYGVDNPSKIQSSQEKKKETCLKKYGFESPLQSQDVQDKRKETMLEKYGTEYYTKTDEFKYKFSSTCLERYGQSHFMKVDEFKEKVVNTNIKRNGIHNLSLDENKKKSIEKNQQNGIDIIKNHVTKFSNLTFVERLYASTYLLRCECGKEFKAYYYQITDSENLCPNCFPIEYKRSSGEKQLADFVTSLGVKTEENSRSIIYPFELDIFSPDHKIAIEFNGLYWHSEDRGKDKNYHLNKTNMCEEKGIRLIQIFEDEWEFKENIVKSKLKDVFGIHDNKRMIDVEKCFIKEVDHETKSNFLNQYHLQENDESTIWIGSFFGKKLVSVMTFSEKHNNVFEMIRFCTRYDFYIPGIESKMLSYFKHRYKWKEIFSYVDRRWSDKRLYHNIGFSLRTIIQPKMWFVKKYNRSTKLEIDNRFLDIETYSKMWDCGFYKFVMEKL